MRPSTTALSLILILLALVGLLPLAAGDAGQAARLARLQAMTRQYGLTDLALFCEARYTRHPSQADQHAAFQDHPAAFDHFPSAAMVPPTSLKHAPDASLARKTASPD